MGCNGANHDNDQCPKRDREQEPGDVVALLLRELLIGFWGAVRKMHKPVGTSFVLILPRQFETQMANGGETETLLSLHSFFGVWNGCRHTHGTRICLC